MPSFKYVALDGAGHKQSGILEATSVGAARHELAGQLFDVVSVREHKSWTQIELKKKKIKPTEIMDFSRQLAAFLRAGIPILQALTTIAEETPSPLFKTLLFDVSDALRGGSSFADAMADQGDIFPSYYIGILRSAELTGHLDIVLDQLSAYIARDAGVRRSIRSALAYPVVVMGMAVITVGILVGYVLPKFKDFFKGFHAHLPFTTQLLLDLGDFVEKYYAPLLILIFGGALGAYLYFRTERGRITRDSLFLKPPVIGDIVRYAAIERFCRILGTMLRAGVPIPDAMVAATDATNNRVYQHALEGAREEMRKGEGLARPVQQTGLFPGLSGQMLMVGEESGTLDEQLLMTADFYETELEHKLKRLTSVFEPAVIIIMGAIVGFVAIALVSAMYGIFNQVKLK